MTERIQEVTKEAICSALYSMTDFSRFLGETPDPATHEDVAWFRLSRDPSIDRVKYRDDPKQVIVGVRADPGGVVAVQCSWINVYEGFDNALRGEQTFRIVTTAATEAELRYSTEQVVLRVLGLFKDVLAMTGVAGPIEKVAPESHAGDPDDPDDLARTDEEVGRE